MELVYYLMTFGMPNHLIPIGTDGTVYLGHHFDWIQHRCSVESYDVRNFRLPARPNPTTKTTRPPQRPQQEQPKPQEPSRATIVRTGKGHNGDAVPNTNGTDDLPVLVAHEPTQSQNSPQDATPQQEKGNGTKSAPKKSDKPRGRENDSVWVPSTNDVLIGKGFLVHSGNEKFRKLIEDRAEEYNSCTSSKLKGQMATDIVRQIQLTGGRFLQKSAKASNPNAGVPLPGSGGWMIVPDYVACDKVKMRFRHLRVAASKATNMDGRGGSKNKKRQRETKVEREEAGCGRWGFF